MNAGPPARRRPALHLTPAAGWLNDPHGIVHAGGRYHLFHQHNPAGTRWSPACHWAHATSADLLAWRGEGIALSPGGGELGCWSGCLVDDDGVPTVAYTRITGVPFGLGQVALARGDPGLSRWRPDPPAAVVAGPPADVDAVAFRDPYVWRAADGWRMVVGVGLAGGVAGALHYRSADLLAWTCDGLLAQRPTTATAGVWTGRLWECPQLFPLDGRWVLLVSVWDDDVLHHVAYAVGDYDGRRFHAATWGRFGHGALYATSAFLDAAGRRCVMSWVREIADVAPPGSAYCGAVSLPYVLALSGDILVARPHPNLADRWSTERRSADLDAAPLAADRLCAAELDLDVPTDARVGVELSGHGLVVAVADGLTLATGHGGILLAMPLPRGAARHRVRLVFDADIVEVVVDGVAGSGAGRLPTGRWESVRVRGSGAGVLRTPGVAAGRAPEGPRPTTGT